MRGVWLVVGVASVAIAAPAAADPPVHLSYAAPEACPDTAAFTAAVRLRAPRATLTDDATAPDVRAFDVRITAGDGGFVGTLATGDADATRALSASRCDDLLAALALITALAIDPTTAVVDPIEPPPIAPPRAPSPWHLAGLLGGGLEAGVMPEAAIAGHAAVRLARAGLGHVDLGALAARQTATTAHGNARFTLATARAAACWTAREGRVALDACGHAELGLLQARGLEVVRAQTVTRTWLAVGAHGAARWQIAAPVFLELALGATLPLVRDRFTFAPNQLIHQANAVVPWVVLGVGVRFR
ncbi:MAG: hypothetical protein K8W52_19065 [Deltaproteobacteria bacterium]|nr:hypothetical protein [Deltaproteobacteria bacterium]